MMERLIAHAEKIGRAAQRRRLMQIAAGFRQSGVGIEEGGEAVVLRGRGLARRWLADPLLRFVGRNGV